MNNSATFFTQGVHDGRVGVLSLFLGFIFAAGRKVFSISKETFLQTHLHFFMLYTPIFTYA